jgi:hypothetical protein
MKIFIIHYSDLFEKKNYILDELYKHDLRDYEFIENYHREHLIDFHKLYFKYVKKYYKLFDNCVKKSMISLIIKHFYAYNIIQERYENALILEEDVILSDNFTNILNNYITQLPEDYDILFIGDGCNLHIEKDKLISNKNIYEKCLYPTTWGGDGASRRTDSYIISKKCAKKLCDYINNLTYKINLPFDMWLNVAARDNNFKVYWAEPTIVTQNRLFTSSNIYTLEDL